MILLLLSSQHMTGPLLLSQGTATAKTPGEGARLGCGEKEMSGLCWWSRHKREARAQVMADSASSGLNPEPMRWGSPGGTAGGLCERLGQRPHWGQGGGLQA